MRWAKTLNIVDDTGDEHGPSVAALGKALALVAHP